MTQSNNESDYYTVEQAAKLMHYSVGNIRLLIRQKKLNAVKIGNTRKLLIPKSEIKAAHAAAPTETPTVNTAPKVEPVPAATVIRPAKPSPNGHKEVEPQQGGHGLFGGLFD